ncbi:hypothetical protein CDD83_3583 [Cordyceps sp. RAO-2017]|nr:hypothetical protein CDD83_3583 [Cordyceps sp. RAO-2017]
MCLPVVASRPRLLRTGFPLASPSSKPCTPLPSRRQQPAPTVAGLDADRPAPDALPEPALLPGLSISLPANSRRDADGRERNRRAACDEPPCRAGRRRRRESERDQALTLLNPYCMHVSAHVVLDARLVARQHFVQNCPVCQTGICIFSPARPLCFSGEMSSARFRYHAGRGGYRHGAPRLAGPRNGAAADLASQAACAAPEAWKKATMP